MPPVVTTFTGYGTPLTATFIGIGDNVNYEVPHHGGYKITLTGSWPTGTYKVHIGPEQNVDARTAYAGVLDSGNPDYITFTTDSSGNASASMWTPPVLVGGPYQIYLEAISGGAVSQSINRYVISRPKVFSDKVFSYNNLLPRHWKRGPVDEDSSPDYATLFELGGGLTGVTCPVKYTEYAAGNVTVPSDDTTVAKTGITAGGDSITLHDPSVIGAGNVIRVFDAGGNATQANPLKIEAAGSAKIWDGRVLTNWATIWTAGGSIDFESTGTNYIARYHVPGQALLQGESEGTSLLSIRNWWQPDRGGHVIDQLAPRAQQDTIQVNDYDPDWLPSSFPVVETLEHDQSTAVSFVAASTNECTSSDIQQWWPLGDVDFTIGVYFDTTTVVATTDLLSYWNDAVGADQHYVLGFDGSKQAFFKARNFAGSGTSTETAGVIADASSNLLLCGHDSTAGVIRLSVNGAAFTTEAITGGIQPFNGGGYRYVTLGCGYNAGFTRHTTAKVKAVMLWDKVVTDAEATGLWNGGTFPKFIGNKT